MEQFPRAASRCLRILFLFTLCGTAFSSAAPVFAQSDIVLYAGKAPSRAGNWRIEPDSSAAGSSRMRYADAGLPKLEPVASPTHYFEMTFNAQAGIPYRLWMRGKADNNSTNNDSVSVQFSGSVDASGN